MKRVLWVTHVYPRFEGDMLGEFLHRLARELPAQGFQPTVICPGSPGAPPRETREGVDIVRVSPANGRSSPIAYTGEMHRAALRHPFAFAKFLRGFERGTRRLIAELDPLLAHAHWWFPSGWIVANVLRGHDRKRIELPFVVSVHGTDVRLVDRIPFARIAARRVFAAADLVLPVSEFLGMRISSLGVNESRREILPMPVDDRVYVPEPEALSRSGLLCVARLTRQKRVDEVIAAFGTAKHQGVPGTLHIAGDGPERARLEALARSVAGENAVVFHGALSSERLAKLVRTVMAVVLASREEGYGLVLVEAARCATPAIGVRSGAIPELIVSGETGWLVEPDDANALARAVAEALTDSRRSEQFGRAARVRSMTSSARTLAERLARLYAKTIEGVLSSARSLQN